MAASYPQTILSGKQDIHNYRLIPCSKQFSPTDHSPAQINSHARYTVSFLPQTTSLFSHTVTPSPYTLPTRPEYQILPLSLNPFLPFPLPFWPHSFSSSSFSLLFLLLSFLPLLCLFFQLFPFRSHTIFYFSIFFPSPPPFFVSPSPFSPLSLPYPSHSYSLSLNFPLPLPFPITFLFLPFPFPITHISSLLSFLPPLLPFPIRSWTYHSHVPSPAHSTRYSRRRWCGGVNTSPANYFLAPYNEKKKNILTNE